MTLKGKVVLVTGSARRVGRAIALAFAAKGARIAAHYHTSAGEARKLVAGARSLSGADADAFRADLFDPAAPQKLADAVARRFGGIDV
ncbi:MAG: SDR family NAD(P)-dependent oxidoreductase, partial [Elusimicrobia bacterium]|nr:SDR family NAD(P)-dependent oxidoreductase [Elusimicrobiota bacterium]